MEFSKLRVKEIRGKQTKVSFTSGCGDQKHSREFEFYAQAKRCN